MKQGELFFWDDAREAEVQRLQQAGWIYAHEVFEDDVVKLGFTIRDVEARRAELQTGNWKKLAFLGMMPGTLKQEQRLHFKYRLAGKRIITGGKEWYKGIGDELRDLFSRTLGGVVAPRPQPLQKAFKLISSDEYNELTTVYLEYAVKDFWSRHAHLPSSERLYELLVTIKDACGPDMFQAMVMDLIDQAATMKQPLDARVLKLVG